jgi:hypothetical protein
MSVGAVEGLGEGVSWVGGVGSLLGTLVFGIADAIPTA